MTKNKTRKINKKEESKTDEPGVIDVNVMPSPPPVSVLPGSNFSTITMGAIDETSCSNNQLSSNSTNTNNNLNKKTSTTASPDIDSLAEEIKALRQKIVGLEEELVKYQFVSKKHC
jgi:hypothetical protein